MSNQTPVVRMKPQGIVLKLGPETTTLNEHDAKHLVVNLQTRLYEQSMKKHREEVELAKLLLLLEAEKAELANWYQETARALDELIALCEA